MKVLFLDCFSGISGDMTVGALCDLGVKPSTLEWELSKMEIGDFHMHFERAQRHHLEGVKFGIHEGATHTHGQDEHGHEDEHGHHHHEHEHQHHEEEHAHGHTHEQEHEHRHPKEDGHAHSYEHEHHHAEEDAHAHSHEHEHEHEHEHSHSAEHGHHHHEPAHDFDHGAETAHEHGDEHHHHHEHEHEHHHHPHVHGRTHRQIRELIEKSDLSPFVKKHALSIFQRIAVAEGKIHGQDPAEVGFHEVGALDSIADIICVCVGLEALGVEKVFVSALHDGHGFIDCAHGRFPLPAPATLEILKGIPIGQIDEAHELITPTGAAIVAEFGESFGLMPAITVEKIGYGIGARKLEARPNVLRAVLGEMPA